MNRVGNSLCTLANIISGVEVTSPEIQGYFDVEKDENQEYFLICYGPYGILPSSDPDCLTAMCWLRICGIEYISECSNEPEMSPNGRLPFVLHSSGRTVTFDNFDKYFAKRRKDVVIKDSVQLIMSLISDQIAPALKLAMWIEDETLYKITKRLYSRAHPWPISEWLCWKLKRSIRNELLLRHQNLDKLRSDSIEALKKLSDLLNNHDYFSGSKPGFVDATAYGLFAVALVILPPTHELRTMIETCGNLRSFVGRMRRKYFD